MQLHVGGSQRQVPKPMGVGPTPSPSEAIFTSHIVNIQTYEEIYEMIGKLYYTDYTLKYKPWISSYLITF